MIYASWRTGLFGGKMLKMSWSKNFYFEINTLFRTGILFSLPRVHHSLRRIENPPMEGLLRTNMCYAPQTFVINVNIR